MIELMRRIGFPPFKRRARISSAHRIARSVILGSSEPLEARMMLAGDSLNGVSVAVQSADVIRHDSFTLFSALSRGGDALLAHSGVSAPLVKKTPPAAVPSPPTTDNGDSDLTLRYIPGEVEYVGPEGTGGVLADAAEGEAGDVSIQIGDGVFVIYNANTGGLRVESTKALSSIEIISRSGIFTGDPANNLGGPFDVDTDVKIFKLSTLTNGGSPIGFADINFGTVAQRNLTDDFVRRDLTIAGSMVPSGGVSSKTVKIEVFPTDLNGNRIREINAGEEFELRATVRDVRATDFQTGGNVGVYSAYFDVEWNGALAQAVGQPIFTSEFGNAQSGTVGNGFLDEVGAVSSSSTPTTTNAQLMFRQTMRATSGGTLDFTLNAADVLPQHETLVFGGTSSVDVTEINFDDDDDVDISDSDAAPDLVAFAKALADAEAVFYGAGWCPHCTATKELFEDGQNFLPFVEVTNPDRSPNDIAIENNISSYPTWVFKDGTRLEGEQTLQALADAAGISIPQSNSPTLIPIDDVDLLSGSPLHIPLDGYDPNGGQLTYVVTSDNPNVVSVEQLSDNRSLLIDVEGFGKMSFKLFEDEAPRAVEQITSLAEDGFYDGLIFHRIINDFVIQGGDPRGDGTGSSDLPDFDDQFDVDLQHNRTGILSMAKTADDTNNSQFFITEDPTRHLDFNHTIFGQLIEGESNRDNISNVETNSDDIATIPVTMKSVTVFNDLENGLIRLSSPEGTTGTANITVTVSDEQGHQFQQMFAVDVKADTVDGGPYLADIAEQVTTSNSPLEFTLEAIDVEGDPVEFSGFSNDPNVTVEVDASTGDVVATPADGFIGTARFTVRVRASVESDTRDPYDAQEVVLVVRPASPSIDLLSVSDTGVSSTDNITNATELQFEISNISVGAEVEILADGNIIGSATADGTTITITTSNLSTLGDGAYEITAVQTFDGETSGPSTVIDLTLDQTDPVDLTSNAPTEGVVQEEIRYNASHAEEGTDGFRYSLQGAPTGASIDPASGEFRWTPTAAQVGTNSFSIVVSDAAGNSNQQDVTISVESNEVMAVRLVAANIDGNPLAAVATGQEFLLQVYVQDIRGESDDLRGVFAAYVDVNFVAELAEITGEIDFGASYPNGQLGITDTDGLVDDAGATATNNPLGTGEFLLMTIPMMATGAGVLDFTSDIADDPPLTDNLLHGLTTALREDQIVFGSTSLTVVDMTFAVHDTYDVLEDGGETMLFVLANDIPVPSTAELTITETGAASNGTVQISTDKKSLIYAPAADFAGTDTFTYTIQDDNGDTSTATVTVNVADVNDAPIANDDTLSVDEDGGESSLDVLANDSIGVDLDEVLEITTITQPANGTAEISQDGSSILYTPNANFSGTDTLTYTISDGRGGSDSADVTITVREVNDPPVAARDIRSMLEDSVLTLNVAELLANDSAGTGEAGQTLTIVGVGNATDGSVSLNGNTITFTPPADFVGTIAFDYTVQDNGMSNGQADPQQATGVVTVNVTNVNDNPTAVDDVVAVQTGTGSTLIDVLSNDTISPDTGETLTITDVSDGSAGGTITISNDGRIEYEPAADFAGEETFTYTISDGNGGTDTATVRVTVQNFVPGGVVGLAYIDSNNDGVFSANENWLSGVKVFLFGTNAQGEEVNLSTRTNMSGQYSFGELTPGNYRISQKDPTFTVAGLNRPTSGTSNGSTVDERNDGFDLQLSADGVGDAQLNFAQRSLDPKFSVWEALASSGEAGLYTSIHQSQGMEWVQQRGGWAGVEITSIEFNASMTHLTITIVENGQTLQAIVPRSDHSKVQLIGQQSGHHLVRLKGDRSEYDFRPVTS